MITQTDISQQPKSTLKNPRNSKRSFYMQRRDISRSAAFDKAVSSLALGNNANTRDARITSYEKQMWKSVSHAQNLLNWHDVRGKRRNKNNSRFYTEPGPHRTRLCHLVRAYNADAITLRLSTDAENSVASLSGVMTCGCVWGCEVCAGRISRVRGREIGQALDWAEANNYVPIMITLTARHDAQMQLQSFKSTFKSAWEHFRVSRQWKNLKRLLGIENMIKAVEVLHGGNGWHYHYHFLVFADKRTLLELDDDEFGGWQSRVTNTWLTSLSRFDLDGLPDYACHVSAHGSVGERYLSKLGLTEDDTSDAQYELSGGMNKVNRGRSIWKILELASQGDTDCDDLYLEYVRAMSGDNWITWSPGFKDLVGIDDVTDEEAAEDEPDTDMIVFEDWYLFSDEEFAPVRHLKAVGDLLAIARLTRSKPAIRVFLAELKLLSEAHILREVADLEQKHADSVARLNAATIAMSVKNMAFAAKRIRKHEADINKYKHALAYRGVFV